MNITNFIKRHPLAAFFALTFIYSWALWSVLVISTPPEVMESEMPPYFFLLAFLGGFGPSLAGVIVTRVVGGRGSIRALFTRLKQWNVNIAWYPVTLLMVPFVSIATLAIQATLGKSVELGDVASRLALALVWPIFSSLGEDFGWRGFALPKLQERHNALVSSLIIGVVWGMWHLPPDFIGIRHYGMLFIPCFIVAGPLLLTAHSILMSWIYNNTKGNLLLMVLYHASLTSSAILFSPLMMSPLENLRHSLISVALYWLIAAIVIATARAKRLVRQPKN